MQDQNLTAINFSSGIVKEQTLKAAEGYWTDADKVRFRMGKPEQLGGWQNVTTSANTVELVGVPRTIETVKFLDGTLAAVVGTHLGLFSSNLSQYNDITPIVTTVPVSNAFSTSVGSTDIVVSVSAHGLTDTSRILITGATATIGGNIRINTSSGPTYYSVSVRSNNALVISTGVTAAATSSQTGSSATLALLYPAGTSSNVVVGGFGTGVYSGAFGWSSSPDGNIVRKLRLWSLDLYGSNVLAVPTSGPLYLWSTTSGLNSRVALVTAAPSVNQIVKVSPEARHVVLYGTHDVLGVYDPLLIRWSSSENFDDWTPTNTNTAGDYRLPSRGSEIMGVHKTADKIAILTDSDLFVQSYIGPNDIFGFIRAGENCGLIGQNAAAEYNGAVYWMSTGGTFFKFDGRLQVIPCTVLRFVFDSLNVAQQDKVVAGSNSSFDEIIWFYPSDTLDATAENDRYVIYNVEERHWTIGALVRTAWKDRDTYQYPLASGDTGTGLYYHEIGYADDGQPMEAFIEAAYFDVKDGNDILFCNKFVPDFSNISNTDTFAGEAFVTLKARKYPGGPIISKGPYRIAAGTEFVSTRLRGRELAVRIESNIINVPWRLGEFRMAIQADGKR